MPRSQDRSRRIARESAPRGTPRCGPAQRYQALRQALEGRAPNENLAERFHAAPDQLRQDFREVDLPRVITQIQHFKAAVDFVKNLKADAEQPVSR